MITVLSRTFSVLSRFLLCLRSACSLRRLSLLLPVGSSAPRLNLRLPPPLSTVAPVQRYFSDDQCASDETYTSTSNLTDFDDKDGKPHLSATLTATPTNRSTPNLDSRHLKSNTSGIYWEHSFSEEGSTFSACARKRRHRHQVVRGCSVERIRVPVYIHGGVKSSAYPNSYFSHIPIRHTSQCTYARNTGHHATKPVLERPPLQGDVCSKTRRVGAPNSSSNDERCLGSSSDEIGENCPHEFKRHLPDAHRITQLETELSRLRSQLARLIVLQEGKHLLAASSEEYEPRLEGDGESDVDPVGVGDKQLLQPTVTASEESRASSPCHPAPPPTPATIPPPPPPPLFPSPPAPKDDWRARLVELRKQRHGSPPAAASEHASSQKPSDMNQVLRELQSGSIKLRSVPRSPGGTPIRTHQFESSNEMDACAIIARALKKKFCRVRAVLDLSGSGGENTAGSSLQESISEPKHLSPTCAIVHSSPCESSNHNPPFGQHLLRRTPGTVPVGFESMHNKNLVRDFVRSNPLS